MSGARYTVIYAMEISQIFLKGQNSIIISSLNTHCLTVIVTGFTMLKKAFTYFSPSSKWFILIGLISTLVHYIVAVGFEFFNILSAVHSNIVGFTFAFPLSYFGHRIYTFSNQKSGHKTSLPRFIVVSVTGFVTNQSMVIMFNKYTILPFWLSLGLVMLIIAICTYLLSRYWAFK